MAKRKRRNTIILVIVLTIVALIFIYPVFLMFLNAFKPFGEVVSDPIALPKKPTLENFSYVVKKIHYLQLFFNNVMITVIGIIGIVAFSSLAAYILDRRRNRYTKFLSVILNSQKSIRED